VVVCVDAQADCSLYPDGPCCFGCQAYTYCEGGNGTHIECEAPDYVYNELIGECALYVRPFIPSIQSFLHLAISSLRYFPIQPILHLDILDISSFSHFFTSPGHILSRICNCSKPGQLTEQQLRILHCTFRLYNCTDCDQLHAKTCHALVISSKASRP